MNKKTQNQSGGPKPAAHTAQPDARTTLSREEVAAIAAEVALAQIVKADQVRAAITKAATESWAQAASSTSETSATTESAQHTPSSAVPSPEMVALIAANLFKAGTQHSVAGAVTNALMLYDEARTRLTGAMKLQAAYEREAAAWGDVPRPAKFPASLDDFLRLIVRAKTPADQMKRFRDFLRDRWKRLAGNGQIENYPAWAECRGHDRVWSQSCKSCVTGKPGRIAAALQRECSRARLTVGTRRSAPRPLCPVSEDHSCARLGHRVVKQTSQERPTQTGNLRRSTSKSPRYPSKREVFFLRISELLR
jgi:hypothetical protein